MTPQQKELFDEFIRSIVQAAGTMLLYSKQHLLTVGRASQSLILLNRALEDDDAATVILLNNELFVNGLPLDKGLHLDRLMREMTDYGIGYLSQGAHRLADQSVQPDHHGIRLLRCNPHEACL